jgi:hypothetical protein
MSMTNSENWPTSHIAHFVIITQEMCLAILLRMSDQELCRRFLRFRFPTSPDTCTRESSESARSTKSANNCQLCKNSFSTIDSPRITHYGMRSELCSCELHLPYEPTQVSLYQASPQAQ